jgi:hypothetical protein
MNYPGEANERASIRGKPRKMPWIPASWATLPLLQDWTILSILAVIPVRGA